MRLLSICMCSVLENKHPGSNEKQTVKIHPAAVAQENLRSTLCICVSWAVKSVYQIHCTGSDRAAVCIDSCGHHGKAATVTIHWLHGDTLYICFSPFGGCSMQALPGQPGSVHNHR